VCTHAGCTVQYTGSEFACPCHGARFSATDGSATRGPAQAPLSSISVSIGPDGQIYADG
jgi:Rieske Fe-S protein